MAVAPEAVPVASPAIVNVMLWFPERQVTVNETVPVEFEDVTQPVPLKDVTPVFAIDGVPVGELTEIPVPADTEVTPVFVTVVVLFEDPAEVETLMPVPPVTVCPELVAPFNEVSALFRKPDICERMLESVTVMELVAVVVPMVDSSALAHEEGMQSFATNVSREPGYVEETGVQAAEAERNLTPKKKMNARRIRNAFFIVDVY
jgi:hypothetical protein